MSNRRPFWTLDCETDPFLQGRLVRPFIWGLYGGPDMEYHEFSSADDVVDFLEPQKVVVYAHNGGKFDYTFLRHRANTDEAISIIGGRLAKFRIGQCEFRDSMNILPLALAAYKKDVFDYAILEESVRDLPHNAEKIRKYLRSDCVNLYELVAAHREENGVVLTQASASMRAWSKQSGTSAPRQSSASYQAYKPYYYGGRVQCFEFGNARKNFGVIDINSAYPHAMLSEHPFSVAGDVMDRLPSDGELHKCMIELDCTARGCFPLRVGDPLTGDLYFPHDEHEVRRYRVTGYELIAALEFDAIKNISISTVHYFPETINFGEFIGTNWDRRKEAQTQNNTALSIILKLLMNSLYGKFGSDYNKYRDYRLCWPGDMATYKVDGWEIEADWTGGGISKKLMSRLIPDEKHRFYNVVTAASITGYVRAMLFRAMQTVVGPIYCDTDSIACSGTGDLPLGAGLGQWKIEGEFDAYSIVGKKTYAFHNAGEAENDSLDSTKNYAHYKIASKGVDLSPSEIYRAAAGETVIYKPDVPTYSAKRDKPIFISRAVRSTAKDIRRVPT